MIHQVHNSSGNYNYNAYIYTNVFWDEHFHENFELIYSIDGDISVRVGNNAVTLTAGEMLLISPNTVHSLSIENAKVWVGVFSEDYIRGFAKEYKYARFSKFRPSRESEKFLRSNLFFQGQPERYMACACLYIACSECVSHAVPDTTKRDNGFISETTRYISANLRDELSLKDVAESLGYEYHYFSTLFNDIFGMNFKSFINTCRINRACELLRDGTISITDVCNECGFGSIRNFNRVFKKMSGITPSEYRSENIK